MKQDVGRIPKWRKPALYRRQGMPGRLAQLVLASLLLLLAVVAALGGEELNTLVR